MNTYQKGNLQPHRRQGRGSRPPEGLLFGAAKSRQALNRITTHARPLFKQSTRESVDETQFRITHRLWILCRNFSSDYSLDIKFALRLADGGQSPCRSTREDPSISTTKRSVPWAVGWRGSISLSVKTVAKLVKTSVVLTVEEAVEAAGFFSP